MDPQGYIPGMCCHRQAHRMQDFPDTCTVHLRNRLRKRGKAGRTCGDHFRASQAFPGSFKLQDCLFIDIPTPGPFCHNAAAAQYYAGSPGKAGAEVIVRLPHSLRGGSPKLAARKIHIGGFDILRVRLHKKAVL